MSVHTADVVDPVGAHLGKDIMHQYHNVSCLIEKEVLPGAWLELWIKGNPYGFNELSRLDGDTGTDGEPPKYITCRAGVALEQGTLLSVSFRDNCKRRLTSSTY